MSPSRELANLLHLARKTGLLDDPPALLSRIIHVLCRERSQPLDPGYVSEPACRRRLSEHPEILPLLETAVRSGNQDGLWDNPHLASEDLDLELLRELYKADAALWENVEDLLSESHERILELATGASFGEVWYPPTSSGEGDPKVVDAHVDFIRALHIPKASDNIPCLLLHKLGSLIDEKYLVDRTDHIFTPDTHTIFINSSGSGKTRLLFEGLCRHWGVYMTCAVDPSGVGCADVSYTLSVGLQKKPYFNGLEEIRERDITRNCYIAQDVFPVPLLSRLLLLSRFLEVVPTAERNTNETRKRWLHLQVLPRFVGCDGLLFELTRSLAALPPSAVQSSITATLLKIRALLGIHDLPIFCALDECQVASQKYPGVFGDDSTTLHQMALSWQPYEHVSVILTGTAADVRPFVDATYPPYRICTDTGAFDTPDNQARYAMHYLPSPLVSSDEGKDLIYRMWLWLRGRHRFTAAFVACLLMTQYQQPRELLNAYIAANLWVQPIDTPASAGSVALKKASRDLVRGFHCFTGQSLLSDGQSYFSAHYAMHKLLLGQKSVTLTENGFPLAAHGLACFTDATGQEVSIYEPTVLCPLLQPLFYNLGVVPGFLPDVMAAQLREVPKHDSLPLTLASLLLHAFEDGPRPLMDLFLFPGTTPDWAMQTAELVCVTRISKNASRTWKYRSSFTRARCEDAWLTDSSKWVHQRSLEPFCEASRFSTADLLFVLRLASGQCLHVAVATMLHNAHVQLSSDDIEQRLDSLAPSKLFPANLAPATTRSLSLPHLGPEASAAGEPSLLRVVCTFPFEVDINTVVRDGHAQPIAAINLATMREVAGSLKANDVARRLLGVLTGTGRRTAKRKHFENDDEKERPRKRPKSMPIHEEKEVECQ